MAVKGQAAKQEVMAIILSTFPDSFLYNDGKEVRVNTSENGEPIQIKITLTKAASIVSNGSDTAIPGSDTETEKVMSEDNSSTKNIEMTEEEKANIKKLAEALGL